MHPETRAKGIPAHVEKFIEEHGLRIVVTPYALEHLIILEDDKRGGMIDLITGKCFLWQKWVPEDGFAVKFPKDETKANPYLDTYLRFFDEGRKALGPFFVTDEDIRKAKEEDDET